MRDKLVIDVSELRLKWACDDLSNALAKLMDDFERIEDLKIAEDIVDLIKCLETYVRVRNETAY